MVDDAVAQFALLLSTLPPARRQAVLAALLVMAASSDPSGCIRAAVDIIRKF